MPKLLAWLTVTLSEWIFSPLEQVRTALQWALFHTVTRRKGSRERQGREREKLDTRAAYSAMRYMCIPMRMRLAVNHSITRGLSHAVREDAAKYCSLSISKSNVFRSNKSALHRTRFFLVPRDILPVVRKHFMIVHNCGDCRSNWIMYIRRRLSGP